MKARTLVLLVSSIAPFSGACAARRELTILSNPPGALVRLDDTIVGTTPFKTSFDAYGTRRVTLYREGYRTVSKRIDVDPPWYARFPLDIVSEVLLPFGWRDPHEYVLDLEPEGGRVTETDLTKVLENARKLRLAEPSGPRPALRATPNAPKPDAPKPVEPH